VILFLVLGGEILAPDFLASLRAIAIFCFRLRFFPAAV